MASPTSTSSVFEGCIPALMTPCRKDRTPDFDALVAKGQELMAAGMTGEEQYRLHYNETDALSASQKAFVGQQYRLFKCWWKSWEGVN